MSDLRQYDEGHSDYLKRRLGVKKLPKTAHQEKAIKGKTFENKSNAIKKVLEKHGEKKENSFEKNWKGKSKGEQNKFLSSAYTREARNNPK